MTIPHNNDRLNQAAVCFAVAVIPSNPIKREIAEASTAISKQFANRNVIDNVVYPAHISLFLGGTDTEVLPLLARDLRAATEVFKDIQLVAEEVYGTNRGLIAVRCTIAQQLIEIFQAVLRVCGGFHQQSPRYRPGIIDRWESFSQTRQAMILQYGTDKLPPLWVPHLSVAEVAREHAADALGLAKSKLAVPQEFGIEAIELVDIGPHNERWERIGQW